MGIKAVESHGQHHSCHWHSVAAILSLKRSKMNKVHMSIRCSDIGSAAMQILTLLMLLYNFSSCSLEFCCWPPALMPVPLIVSGHLETVAMEVVSLKKYHSLRFQIDQLSEKKYTKTGSAMEFVYERGMYKLHLTLDK